MIDRKKQNAKRIAVMSGFYKRQRRAKFAAIAESFAIALGFMAIAYITVTLPLAI